MPGKDTRKFYAGRLHEEAGPEIEYEVQGIGH
jgi:hypothetical protein